ncbi:MAG: ABC transporter permease [Clostridiales Family XIII bacterium]|jgi:peptide/nickel transport system permease protein|nr:ABC transporter permease [Clostridiales Family XIII bacterium]
MEKTKRQRSDSFQARIRNTSARYPRLILKRLLVFFPLLFAASLVIFFSLRLSGVDPVNVMLGERQATEDVIFSLREQFHLNEPLIAQYWQWVKEVFSGSFGIDYINRQSVAVMIGQRAPITLGLVIMSTTIGTVIAVGLGVLSAVKQNTILDRVISVAVLIFVSAPSFLVAIGTLIFLTVFMPDVAFTGAINSVGDYFSRLIMPSFILALYMLAIVTRVTRSGMIIQLRSAYATAAIAKGLPMRVVIWKHCFRNAFIPVLTIVTIFIGAAISSAVLVESVFSLPGLGGLLTQAIKTNNYPIVQACLFILLLLFLSLGLIADLIYMAVDPRARIAGKKVLT